LDTKLKNYRYSVWFKLLAVLLCVAGMLTLAYGLLKAPYFEAAVQNTDFKESMIIKNDLFNTFYSATNIAFKYKNEDYIKSGAAIDTVELYNRTSSIMNEKSYALQEIENNYNESIQPYKNAMEEESINNINENNSSDLFTYPEVATESQSVTPKQNTANTIDKNEKNFNQERIDLFNDQRTSQINELNKKFDALIKDTKTEYINEQLSDYHAQMDILNSNSGVCYTVVADDKDILSNIANSLSTEAFYKELPYSTRLTQNNVHSFFYDKYSYKTSYFTNNVVVYLGMTPEKYNSELTEFNQKSAEGLLGIKISSLGLLAFLIGLIYLIYAAGKRPDKEGVQLIAIDHVYLDIALAVTVGAIALCITPLLEFGQYLFTDKYYLNNNLLLVASSVIISIGTLIGILFVTIFSKRVKRHEVIKHTLIFKVCSWIVQKLKSIYATLTSKINSVFDRSPLAIRLVLIFGAYAVIVMISTLLFLAGSVGILMGFAGIVGVNVVAIYFLLKIFKTFKSIKDGAERIRTGELSYNIPVQGIPELRQLSNTINKIADGLKTAVSSQVKSERMKAELITNVSHDLKTPLTSIITYVDLLKSEGLQSENAEKYLGIIDTKSQRLKALTEDLFEAAKATSGNIAVNFEMLDVISLINQGLGELSDKIAASGLNFRTNLPSEKLFVNADGKLLWRVIENLLSNVFKYALPNSRVYIDAFATAENVTLIIKNISAYELNINEDELMERFKRGDASRHSEGSGLGLSIAKSLTELQGGNFYIEIDGDLFKATIELPKSK